MSNRRPIQPQRPIVASNHERTVRRRGRQTLPNTSSEQCVHLFGRSEVQAQPEHDALCAGRQGLPAGRTKRDSRRTRPPRSRAHYHSGHDRQLRSGRQERSRTTIASVLDAAAFHIDWKNIQLFTVVVANSIRLASTSTASGAKSDGVELTARPGRSPGLDLSLKAPTRTLVSPTTRLRKSAVSGAISCPSSQSSAWPSTAIIMADRFRDAGSCRRVVAAPVGSDGTYDLAFVTANGRQRHIRAYGSVDLNAGVDFGRFDARGYVKNLGNSRGCDVSRRRPQRPIFPNGAIGTGIIRPRTVGLSLGLQLLKGNSHDASDQLARRDCDAVAIPVERPVPDAARRRRSRPRAVLPTAAPPATSATRHNLA